MWQWLYTRRVSFKYFICRLEYPVPASAVVVPSGTPGCYDVTGFDLCCTVKLCYNDEYVRYGCAGNYYARLVRNWTAEDCKTNRTTCSDTIYFRKGTLATIVCPPSYDGVDPDGAGPIAKILVQSKIAIASYWYHKYLHCTTMQQIHTDLTITKWLMDIHHHLTIMILLED